MSTWDSSTFQENQVPFEQVLFKEHTIECEIIVQYQTTLRNKFKVVDQKPFHPFFPSEVSFCMLHSSQLDLRLGRIELFPETVMPDKDEIDHGVEQSDNEA
jgi:hypothetical protein